METSRLVFGKTSAVGEAFTVNPLIDLLTPKVIVFGSAGNVETDFVSAGNAEVDFGSAENTEVIANNM